MRLSNALPPVTVRFGVSLLAVLIALLATCTALGQSATRRQIREWVALLQSGDQGKRVSAATSLLTTGGNKGLTVLLDTLKPNQPEEVRVSIITAFHVTGDDRATSRLIAALEDKSDAARKAAIGALQAINTPHAVSLMEQTAADRKRPPQTRSQVIAILGEMRARDAIPTLIEQLSDKDDSVCKAARVSLEQITLRTFDSAREWHTWWENSKRKTREEMLEELVTRQSELIRKLSRRLEELDLIVLKGRKDHGDPTPILATLEQTTSSKVKLYCIGELAKLAGKAGVLDALLKALNDHEYAVRKAAAEALGNQGDKAAVPALIQTLNDLIISVRTAAAHALGKLKSKDAVPPLCRLLTNGSEEVAVAAAAALGEIKSRQATRPLIQAVTKDSTPPKLYAAAANALAKIRDPEAVPTFIALLESPKANVRWAAVDALGELRAPAALERLSTVARKDKNPQIREVAIAALAKIGSPAALDTVVAALSDADKRVSDQALRSLLQLADLDGKLYAKAVERLLADRQFALAESVLASAVEKLQNVPNHAKDIAELQDRMARSLLEDKQWSKAQSYFDKLLVTAPKEPEYIKGLVTCLKQQGKFDALLAILAQARKNVPGQAEYWWKETVLVVETVAKSGDAKKVISIVDSLEKEDPNLGGEDTAAKLRELRQKAQETTGAGAKTDS